MNKKTKVFFYIGFILLAITVFLLVYWFYISNKNSDNMIRGIKKVENTLFPSPLEGPDRNLSSNNLYADEIIVLTNKERTDFGENELKTNELLNNAARDKLDNMFDNQYFEHVSPIDGKDISNYVIDVGYEYSYIGENLAMGDFEDEQEMVNAWMNSPGHRENILNKNYTEIGVAVAKGYINDRDTWMAVQIFGQGAKNCDLPDNELLSEIERINNILEDIDSEYDKIEDLRKESENLINEGNGNIKKGNEIYESTKDKEEAEKYWNLGEQLYNDGIEKNNEANILIEEINNYAQDSEKLKNMIDEYNNQVDIYNQCISE